MRRSLAFPILVLLPLLPAPRALAAWAPDGNPLCTALNPQFASSAVVDGAGGTIVAFSDGRVFAQHVDAAGLIPPGWATNGNPISSTLDYCVNAQAASDGLGGAFAVWEDGRSMAGADLYAQHVLASGALDPAWPATDLPVGTGPTNQYTHSVAPDGAGGVLVAWQDDRNDVGVTNLDIYAQRINVGGTALWTPNGQPVCLAIGVESNPKITGDGLGGAYIAWIDARNSASPRVYAQHLTAAGDVAPGWPNDGLPVANPGALGAQYGVVVAPDGFGGVLIAWSGSNNQAVFHPFVIRFGPTGVLAPGWPVAGAQLCNLLQTQDQVQVVSDLTGGAIVVWHDWRDVQNPVVNYHIYAQRVNASGARQWALNGVPVCTAPGSQETPAAVSDDQGGVVVTWQDGRGDGADIYGLRLTSLGAPAPGWDVDGTALCVQPGPQQSPLLVPDGVSGAIVAWTDGRGPRFQASDVYATRTPDDVVVPVLASLLSASAQPDRVALAWQLPGAGALARVWRRAEGEAWAIVGDAVADAAGRLTFEDHDVRAGTTYDYRLGLVRDGVEAFAGEARVTIPGGALALAGARPNPAVDGLSIAFTLPDAAPATLDLLDVGGRVVESRAVGALGAGPHVVRMDDPRPLRPGIYYARLRHAGRALMARVAVVR